MLGLFVGGSRPAAAVTGNAPNDIALSASSLVEGSAQGTVVGLLSATDPDAGDPVTFTLVDSAGGRFQIVGASLQAGSVATDYEAATAHNITVRATDAAGNSYDETFGITVTDIDDTAPTITSSNSVSVPENAPLAHALTANESVTWSIVGGADQTQFEIDGSTLQWVGSSERDYELPADVGSDNSYQVTVRATDTALLTTDQTITVTVTDVVEGSWQEVLNQTLDTNNIGWNGFNMRQHLTAALLGDVSGSKVRLTLEASTGGGAEDTQVAACYIGHAAASGDAWDFDGTQVQVTVGGSGAFIASVGVPLLTDEISYAFDHTKALIAAFHFNNSAKDSLRQKGSLTGATNYFKSAADETSTSDVTGYSTSASTLRFISKIEVLG